MLYRLRPLLAALMDRDASTRALRWHLVALTTGYLITVGLIGGIAYSVWMYWPTLLFGDVLGGGLFSALLPWIYVMRIPLDVARLSQATSDSTLLAFALRHALEANDATIAPVAADEPATSAPMTAHTFTLANPTPLIMSRVRIVGANVLGVLMLGGCALTVVLTTVALNLPVEQFATVSPSDLIIPATVTGALTLCALICFVVGARLQRRLSQMRRGMSLSIDSLGITYHQPVWARQSTTITWADMRALAQFTYIDQLTRTHLVYLLDSEAHTLLWEVPPDDRYGPTKQREMIASQQESGRALAQRLREHTRLPLHDLSETVAQIVGHATSNMASVPFLRRAYNVALAEKDVAVATALWHAAAPGAREPRALRKLAESSPMPRISAPVNAPTTPYTSPELAQAPGVNSLTTRVNTWLASTMAQQQSMMKVARAFIPHLPTTNHAATTPSMQRYLRSVSRRRAMTIGFVWMQLALLVCFLAGTGFFWLSERQVDHQIASVPQQIQAEKPTYFAPLTSAQADWSTGQATKDDPTAAQFVHGSYELSCKDPNSGTSSWILTEVNGDIALSATVTIHGPVDKAGYSTAGVLFDTAGDGNTSSAFGVDESGDWTLFNFDAVKDQNNPWINVDSGSSSAIHKGDGATNTLMVVRHGPLYLLYVNNVLMDRFYDKDHALTPGGYIGTYIDSGDISADFNDFTMYPVPKQLATIPLTTDVPSWLTR